MSLFKFSTPNESLGFSLWKVSHLWQREINKILKPYDLTHMQFVVLASAHWLSSQQEVVMQVDIANLTDIDKMMTSNVIHKLVEKGLLVSTKHPTDTRAKVISLTDSGIRKLKTALAKVEAFDTQFFARVESDMFSQDLLKLLD